VVPVDLSVHPFIVARQWLGKHIAAAKEEMFEASFTVRSVSYQRKKNV
jgi:hypothetical protein